MSDPAPADQPAASPPTAPVVAAGTVRKVPQKPHIADRFSLWAVKRIRRLRKAGAALGNKVGARTMRAFGFTAGVPVEEEYDLTGVDQDRLSILRAIADRKRAPRVLFVDGDNGARSMMCEAYAISMGLYAESAGPFPAAAVDAAAVYMLKERKMDISAWRPKILVPQRMDAFDRVVVLGDAVPEGLVRHPNVERWSVPLDPKGFPLEGYRLTREQSDRQVRKLARRLAGLKTRRRGSASPGMQAKRMSQDPSITRGPAPPSVSLGTSAPAPGSDKV